MKHQMSTLILLLACICCCCCCSSCFSYNCNLSTTTTTTGTTTATMMMHNASDKLTNASTCNGSRRVQSATAAALALIQVLIAYFRQHAVRSLILVICPEQIDANAERQQLQRLLQRFNDAGLYTLVFNGHDYAHEHSHSHASAFPPRSDSAYEPPRTFRTDNATRRPLRFRLRPLAYKSGILLVHFATPCALNVLRWCAASEHNYFVTNRYWLLLAHDESHLHLLEDDEIFLPPDSEVRVLLLHSPTTTTMEFALIDVYKVAAEKPLKQRCIGTHLRDGADMLTALQRFGSAISYRENLEGITFNTGIVIAFPDLFTNIEDLRMRHIDTISKVNNRITIELANKLNMRFNTHQTDNYGWHQPNGSFDGLMGRFQRYELDFAQSAIFMRLDRFALCDFVAETYRVRAGIMFRQPPLSAVANIFAMPFDEGVWISILFLMIFTVVVFTLELLFSPHEHKIHVLDCVVFVWGALCQQGFYVDVANRSARIIVFTTFVAALFLFTSFSANIVALLQSPSEAIHTLSDLTQSPLDVGVQDTVYNKIYFTESTDSITNRLYYKKIAPKGDSIYMRPAIGIEKMRTGLFAYQVELQTGYQIVSDTFSEPEKCGLKELEPFQLPMIAIPTRKNFPYKELFRRQLRWQREVGLMNREARKWLPQKPKCESGMGGFMSIGLTECRYALAIFGYGTCLGITVFLMELLFKYVTDFYRKAKDAQKLIATNI